jgi:hypothetical protein
MNYKKIVSLLAVSTLALAACGTEQTEEPTTDDTEQVEDAATEGAEDTESTEDTEGTSSVQEQIEQAKEQSGEAFPEYGLYVAGQWTEDGIEVNHAPGESATIPVQVTTEAEEYHVYLVEDGIITQVVSNEPEPELVVESPSADTEYLVGISPDNLGAEGDEVAEEDFYRVDKVLLVEQEPTAEEEAE